VWIIFYKMAVEFGRFLPLLLIIFLASTSSGQESDQDLSAFTVRPIPEVPHEKFDVIFYKNAQKYTEDHWREMSAGQANDFSQYSVQLETRIRQKMAEYAGNPNLSVEDMSTIIQKKINEGDLTSAEISVLQAHTMATQEAYVKRVIEIFDLSPDDLDTTSKIFCDVFEVCQFITTTISSTTPEFTTVENTPKITTIKAKSSSTTTTTTTIKVTEKSTTEEMKTETIPPATTESKIDPVNHESSPTTTVEALPSSTSKPVTSEKTMVKEAIIVTEKIENPDANFSEKTPIKVSERRSDEGLLKIEDSLPTVGKPDTVTPAVIKEQEMEPEEPEVEPVKSDQDQGWGSGSSRTSHFASTMLLCSLILTLSNLL